MSRNRDRTLALLAYVSPLGCSCCRESRDGQDSAFLCFRCCCCYCYCCFVSFYCRSQHHFFFCSKILHFWLTSRHSAVAARKVETDKNYHLCFVYFVVVVLSVVIVVNFSNYFHGKIFARQANVSSMSLMRACFLGKYWFTKWPQRINGHFCEPVTMLSQQLLPLVCLQPSKKHSLRTRSAEPRKLISEKKKRGNMFFLVCE